MRVGDSRRGGVLFGLLISALLVICVLTFTGIYVARNIRVSSRDRPGGADVSIDVPGGHLSVRAHDKPGEIAAGIPIYPGARARKDSGGDAVVEWSSNRGDKDKGFVVTASDLITDDPMDKVVDYYRRQLPDWVVTKDRKGSIHMELRQGGYQRIVAISEKSDGTHIGVATVGEPASN
jgi:hypothetical protein